MLSLSFLDNLPELIDLIESIGENTIICADKHSVNFLGQNSAHLLRGTGLTVYDCPANLYGTVGKCSVKNICKIEPSVRLFITIGGGVFNALVYNASGTEIYAKNAEFITCLPNCITDKKLTTMDNILSGNIIFKIDLPQIDIAPGTHRFNYDGKTFTFGNSLFSCAPICNNMCSDTGGSVDDEIAGVFNLVERSRIFGNTFMCLTKSYTLAMIITTRLFTKFIYD
jgi:hypothetical protein